MIVAARVAGGGVGRDGAVNWISPVGLVRTADKAGKSGDDGRANAESINCVVQELTPGAAGAGTPASSTSGMAENYPGGAGCCQLASPGSAESPRVSHLTHGRSRHAACAF